MTKKGIEGIEIPDVPLVITHMLSIAIDTLSAISTKLYEKGEEDVGMEVDDAIATLQMVRRQCKDKKL